jgi:hypothetical protein
VFSKRKQVGVGIQYNNKCNGRGRRVVAP